jgi:hypothetical protein
MNRLRSRLLDPLVPLWVLVVLVLVVAVEIAAW